MMATLPQTDVQIAAESAGRTVMGWWRVHVEQRLGLETSHGQETKSGTTLSGPGTYLISWKLYSAKKSNRRKICWEGNFCVKRLGNCKL